jgi:hypothetical protein
MSLRDGQPMETVQAKSTSPWIFSRAIGADAQGATCDLDCFVHDRIREVPVGADT